MSLDRQSAVAAERRRLDVTIHAIRPARISAPSRIHSQSRLVPELLPEAAALGDVAGVGEVALSVGVAVAVAVAVTVSVDGSAVGVVGVGVGVVGVGVTVAPAVAELTADAARLVALPIALLTLLPHPATRHPATSMTTGREKPFVVNRMPGSFRLVNWGNRTSMMAVRVGVGVTVGVGVAVAPPVTELAADAARLVALPIALLTLLPHPATRHPATSRTTGREKPLIVNRMPGPSAWSTGQPHS